MPLATQFWNMLLHYGAAYTDIWDLELNQACRAITGCLNSQSLDLVTIITMKFTTLKT